MEFSSLNTGDRSLIQAYGDGGFRISGQRFEGSLIVFENRVLRLELKEFSKLAGSDLQPLEDAGEGIEILLLGCGAVAGELDPSHRQRLKHAGISVELMGTGAACRTFNVLQAEGRRVAALLIAVP